MTITSKSSASIIVDASVIACACSGAGELAGEQKINESVSDNQYNIGVSWNWKPQKRDGLLLKMINVGWLTLFWETPISTDIKLIPSMCVIIEYPMCIGL